MLKLTTQLRALILLSVVLLSIATRVLIGYTAFANPIVQHVHPTLHATSSQPLEYGEAIFHTFKLKRKIALETLTHFPVELRLPTLPAEPALSSKIHCRADLLAEFTLRGNLRPPIQA